MRYPGGKGRCFQQIINLMPPHHTYIESHLGGGAVMRNKRPAQRNIGIEKDDRVIGVWRAQFPEVCELVHTDATKYLRAYPYQGNELIYCDPPYMPSTRKRSKVYRHDYTVSDHEGLLEALCALPCMVVISGYASPLYEAVLSRWNKADFPVKTHTGISIESVWFNFDQPTQLHDSRYLGTNFREREIAKRRQQRLRARLSRLPIAERHALIDWMINSGEFVTQSE